MKLPELNIGGLCARLPIIQGGMGIGVSLSRLASAVANEGGIGIISGVQIGFRDPHFRENPVKANLKAIGEEIAKARALSPRGIIGMNFMSIDSHYAEYVREAFRENPVKANLKAIGEEIAKARALSPRGIIGMNFMSIDSHYAEYVREAVKNGIDLIISGAGLPLALPELVSGTKTRILPIVSSARACRLVLTNWLKKHNRIPDGVVVEGPKAGGHLGFKLDDLLAGTEQKLEDALTEVLALVRDFEVKHGVKIPVIAAGGLNCHADIERMLKLGADGVQMGTVFVATEECDAADGFKQTYVNAKPGDARIILSPTGFAARAVNTEFVQRAYDKGGIPVEHCFGCMPGICHKPGDARIILSPTGFAARAVNTEFVQRAYDKGGIPVEHCFGCMPGICHPDTTPYCLSNALFQSARGEGGLVFCGARVDEIHEITTVPKLMRRLSGLSASQASGT